MWPCPIRLPRRLNQTSPVGYHCSVIHVVLVQPEIHWNTGNIGRSCLAAGARLHLVRPLGFHLGAAEVRRAGLDYWERVDPRVWECWNDLEREIPRLGTPWLFSTGGERLLWDVDLRGDVVLVFGRETAGLPEDIRDRWSDRLVRIPQSSGVRSLNLSTAAGIALWEALRQQRRPDSEVHADLRG